MKLEDVKVGMKVKLLGKHGAGDNYNNIEDWFKDIFPNNDIDILKSQGFGYVIRIDYGGIWVDECENGIGWAFIPSDLEPYEEEPIEESTSTKTPKEWLLTPSVIFTLATGEKCITLGNGTSYVISNGKLWCSNLDKKYNEDLADVNNRKFEDIIKITYEGEVVWERKEEIKKMTLKEIEKELGYKIAIISE